MGNFTKVISPLLTLCTGNRWPWRHHNMIIRGGSVQGQVLHSVIHVGSFQFSLFCDPVIKSHSHLCSATVGLDSSVRPSLPYRLQSPSGLREPVFFLLCKNNLLFHCFKMKQKCILKVLVQTQFFSHT